MDKKIIFLHSISPRSGHNFVAEIIRIYINTSTPLGLRSEIPFGVFIKNYEEFKATTFGSTHYQEYFDDLFIKGLRDEILKSGNVLIKNTSLIGAEEVKKMFPMDIHIISIRNPRDVLLSVFKGMKFKNNFKSKIKKILLPTGLYHYWYARKYSGRMLNDMPDLEGFDVFKYEDFVTKNENELLKLKGVLSSTISLEELLVKMDAIKVINTSFYKEETSSTNIWDSKNRTKKFNPINRNEMSFMKNKLLHFGLSKLSNKLNY